MLNIFTNKKAAAVAALAVVPTTLAMGGIMTSGSASALTYTIPNGYTTITDANFYDCVARNFVRDFPSEEIPATGLTDAQLAKMDRLRCDASLTDNNLFNLINMYGIATGFVIDQAFVEEHHIASTKGLEKMLNLTDLEIFNVGDGVDVSHNTKLKSLVIVSKELTSLDVSRNTELRELFIINGTLSGADDTVEETWDIDPNAGTINRGKLANLDVSHNKELQYLEVNASSITNIDISQNTKLTTLYMRGNSIFDLSQIESAISSNDNLDYVSLYRQEKTVETHSTTYELPPLFTQIKAEQLGEESQFELENATLSSDGKSITITDKTKPASIKIVGGLADGTILTVVYAEESTPEDDEPASGDTETAPEDTTPTQKDDKTTPKDTESVQKDASSPEIRTPNTGFTTGIESGSDELNPAAIICALAFTTATLSYGAVRTLSRKKIFRA